MAPHRRFLPGVTANKGLLAPLRDTAAVEPSHILGLVSVPLNLWATFLLIAVSEPFQTLRCKQERKASSVAPGRQKSLLFTVASVLALGGRLNGLGGWQQKGGESSLIVAISVDVVSTVPLGLFFYVI